MPLNALPDLDVLPAEALRTLILAQHQELISEDPAPPPQSVKGIVAPT
jgi:hypothetical protein